MDVFEVSADVHALIEDLLPVVNPSARFEAELARVVLPVGRFEPAASTWTILERCARAEPPRWPGLVEEWLREVTDRAVLAIADIELLGDVRELLRLRIVPRLTEEQRSGLVVLPAGEHFDALVVIDHPEFGGPLTEARARLLGLRGLGRFVIPNTYERELADVQVRDQPITPGEMVRVVTKPGCRYVSALYTEVERFLPDVGEAGALLAMPVHSTILLYPVTSAAVNTVLPALAQVAAEMYAADADPCAPGVYWWRRGHPLTGLDPAAPVPVAPNDGAGDRPRPRRRRPPWRRR
ncbi:hypothetical protein SAMN04489712_10126 [Thermomonospora echinospora]|uniref:Uncharacterized protein n=1 Tax=Thermomonospora echinospora TaxID=1992 RepID=A0A1H5S076_9ACTN|nr:hypothetical protein [Thermomonospora echinospora]SEF43975.1 hypothetical protein SAMN04489712_10126 [Thermomonospora echinospora]